MTERGRRDTRRAADGIAVGPSAVRWIGDALQFDIDESTAPLPSRLRGTVTLRPHAIAGAQFALDGGGRHYWRPVAPRARIDVTFAEPGLSWRGEAYMDSNWGDEPLERGFQGWDWSRAHAGDSTTVYYDAASSSGEETALALRFDRHAEPHAVEPPPRIALPSTFWGVRRTTRGDADDAPVLQRTLEDAPFYARSSLGGRVNGAAADIVHESLSLRRFANPLVRAMLVFRMPRIVGRR